MSYPTYMLTGRPGPEDLGIADEVAIPAFCEDCGADLTHEEETRVVVSRGIVDIFFCNNTCRMKQVYEKTETASGKAAILRFIAALYLLGQTDLAFRAPMVSQFEADGDYGDEIKEFTEQGAKLLKYFDEDGGNAFAADACNAALELSEQLGKMVK